MAAAILLLSHIGGIPVAAKPSASATIPTLAASGKTSVAANPGRAYLFPDSSQKPLTPDNLANVDARILELARNEILARHGNVFTRADLKAYFGSKTWYHPDSAHNGELTDVEKKNIQLIQKYEQFNRENKLYQEWDVDSHVLGYPDNKDTYRRLQAAVDLNGDGKEENIRLAFNKHGEVGDEWTLNVNNLKLEVGISKMYATTYFTIVDADTSDSYFEIAFENYGPDADRSTTYYYYDGARLLPMGTLDGLTANSDSMNGHGHVTASKLIYDFQSRFILMDYLLNSNHVWKEVPNDYYPMEPPTPWTAKLRFPIYSGSRSQQILRWIKPGEKVYFLGGDGKEIGKVRTQDGTIGWIRVKDDKLSGTNRYLDDCLDGRLLYG
ncbi:YARHG domain-containing protein [Paenibacillus sinensis]|nr:YARHG domain-containing protein [Paenibacillus sinensis]